MPNQLTDQQQIQQVQDAIAAADETLKKSKVIIATAQTHLNQLDAELKQIDDDNAKAQAVIDQDIIKIVQGMDEETVKFVKATE